MKRSEFEITNAIWKFVGVLGRQHEDGHSVFGLSHGHCLVYLMVTLDFSKYGIPVTRL